MNPQWQSRSGAGTCLLARGARASWYFEDKKTSNSQLDQKSCHRHFVREKVGYQTRRLSRLWVEDRIAPLFSFLSQTHKAGQGVTDPAGTESPLKPGLALEVRDCVFAFTVGYGEQTEGKPLNAWVRTIFARTQSISDSLFAVCST